MEKTGCTEGEVQITLWGSWTQSFAVLEGSTLKVWKSSETKGQVACLKDKFYDFK